MNVVDYVASLPHPKLSASIDGIWLEDEVPGFRTSYVQGRESYDVNVDEITSKRIDGSRYSGRQIPSRDLRIHYYITTDTYEQFQQSFNNLRKLLWQKEEVKIIFGDEPNMFYVGTPTALDSQFVANNHNGEGDITIHCCKPFKYSVEEYEITPNSEGVFEIDYTGSYPAFPILEATSKSDLGYVSMVNQDAKIIQIGTPDDVNLDGYGHSVERISHAWYNGGNISDFSVNTGSFQALGKNSILTRGSLVSTAPGVRASDYGTTTQTWHGPSITRTFDPIKNFISHWHITFVGDTTGNNIGLIQYNIGGVDADGNHKIICSVTYVKEKTGTNSCISIIHINGKQLTNTAFTCEHTNSMSGVVKGAGRGYIERFGTHITVVLAGGKIKKTFDIPEIKDYKATDVNVCFAKWGKQNGVESKAVTSNYIKALSVWEHNVNAWEDVPNKFANGDVIEADCSEAKISVNDVITDKLGALGNDWEDFVLSPGPNQIKCLWSSWASTKPEFKIKYRNVYI